LYYVAATTMLTRIRSHLTVSFACYWCAQGYALARIALDCGGDVYDVIYEDDSETQTAVPRTAILSLHGWPPVAVRSTPDSTAAT
jgi:hypothetical protein